MMGCFRRGKFYGRAGLMAAAVFVLMVSVSPAGEPAWEEIVNQAEPVETCENS